MTDEGRKTATINTIMQSLMAHDDEDVPTIIMRALERRDVERNGGRTEVKLRALLFGLLPMIEGRLKSI